MMNCGNALGRMRMTLMAVLMILAFSAPLFAATVTTVLVEVPKTTYKREPWTPLAGTKAEDRFVKAVIVAGSNTELGADARVIVSLDVQIAINPNSKTEALATCSLDSAQAFHLAHVRGTYHTLGGGGQGGGGTAGKDPIWEGIGFDSANCEYAECKNEAPAANPAEVSCDKKIQTYDIDGKTLAEVIDNLKQYATEHFGGEEEFGSCNSGVNIDGKQGLFDQIKETKCPVCNMEHEIWKTRYGYKTLTVTEVSIIIVPNWTEYANASAAAKKEWDRFILKLTAHEEKHHAFAVEWANAVIEQLKDMKGIGWARERSKSGELSILVFSARDAKIQQEEKDTCDAKNKKYDEETDHGRKKIGEEEGAVLRDIE